ncbi:hypothetical protein [Streptomyces sp. V4I2]|uniref:hypothetical protein n=1 Tax=Streptomyces sp. V4I2 TaxID=3042280 RepID=UPI002780B8E3|nr:hypothetical protein [Streptomyces sp. V4I2]MDQ1051756.1 hypothetical protein [Streptomyces sp. V4I2]
MEIKISDGIVSRVRGADAPMNGLAIQARTVANFLPLSVRRAGADILHNIDDKYTGIRVNTKRGPVVLEMPTGDANYRLVHQLPEPNKAGQTEVEMRRFPQIYKPHGIALILGQFLESRGFLS